jgi:hypothetical protein
MPPKSPKIAQNRPKSPKIAKNKKNKNEKIAQNVAQPIFGTLSAQVTLTVERSSPKYRLLMSLKLPNVHNHPMGENSPKSGHRGAFALLRFRLLRVENDLDVDSRQSAVAAEGARLIFE